MKVKKILDIVIKDKNIEITRKQVIDVPEEEEEKIKEFVEELIVNDNDPEESFSHGISCDYYDEIAWINFKRLVDYLKERQKDLEDEGEKDCYEYDNNKKILPILIKYEGYTYNE